MKRWTFRILICLILGAATTVGVAWGCAKWSRLGVRSGIDGDRVLWPYPSKIIIFDDRDAWSLGSKEPLVVDLAQHYEGRGLTRLVWINGARVVGGFLLTTSGGQTLTYDLRHFDIEARGPVIVPGRGERNLWSWSTVSSMPASSGIAPFIIEQQAGWPCRSLYSRTESQSIGVFRGQAHHWGFETSPTQHAMGADPRIHLYRVIPFLPRFPGFIINTLFYAAIWFGVFFGLSAARRTYRRRRGRCIKCGYDLRGGTLPPPASEGRRAVRIAGCPECGWGRES